MLNHLNKFSNVIKWNTSGLISLQIVDFLSKVDRVMVYNDAVTDVEV